MEGRVLFKGKQSYLEVMLEGEIRFEDALRIIREKLESGRSFFAGSACVRILGGDLDEEQKASLEHLFKDEYGIITTEFLSVEKARELDEQARRRGRAERERAPKPQPEDPPLNLKSGVASARQESSVFVRETVRSGQRIISEGNIVVLGDVNNGAQLIANGSIVVMGNLRGIAHAGAGGDEYATVSAFRLAPLQLRIGSCIAIAPEGEGEVDYPETAGIDNGVICVRPIADARKIK